MVRDWWRSWREGEDALMIAKVEFQVGDARFAVGDQVITRGAFVRPAP